MRRHERLLCVRYCRGKTCRRTCGGSRHCPAIYEQSRFYLHTSWRIYHEFCLVRDIKCKKPHIRGLPSQRRRLSYSQLLFLGACGDNLVFPVHVLRHGNDQDGEIRFLELEHSHGIYHRIQQYLGALLSRMEGIEQPHASNNCIRDTRADSFNVCYRIGELSRVFWEVNLRALNSIHTYGTA